MLSGNWPIGPLALGQSGRAAGQHGSPPAPLRGLAPLSSRSVLATLVSLAHELLIIQRPSPAVACNTPLVHSNDDVISGVRDGATDKLHLPRRFKSEASVSAGRKSKRSTRVGAHP